ncbi:uncharacterized protein An02g00957 [Aspergillus niger]|uniref:Contig An02c0010, genomic contig n=3 Tax=Aspergillus niger TaxID=5061 RepID=A2QBR2_ASPNC|nr:uncharacterized protein An02g00957 [Aspergillus niger]CAK96309.1 unnamed protein product [Aspergillus niger]
MPGFSLIAETYYSAMTRMPSWLSGNCTYQSHEPWHHSCDVMSIHAIWQVARVRFSCSTAAISLRLKRRDLFSIDRECFKHFDSDYKRLLPRYHKGSLSSDQHPARPYLPVDQWYEDTILSDTLSNTMAQPAESSVSYELTRKSHMGGECILKRFSQWFWSVWMIAGSGTHDALADPANHPRATNGASTKTNGCAGTARDGLSATGECDTGLRERSSENEHSYPCKACQTWGVVCDQQRPRCSHCLDQQILCFYVAPLQKPPKRSTKSRSRHVELVNSPPRLLAN